jgi:MFS family permease
MDPAERRSIATQAAVGLASFLTPFVYGALSVAMPTIGRAFDFSPREMTTVLMVHLLLSTSCNLPFGRLSDRIGRKRVFMAGSLLFALSSVLAGLAGTPWLLVAARALQGVGDAMTFGVSAAILVSVVPPERIGRALGMNITFVYAGLALGPLVGGVLTAYLSWRVIFFLSSASGVAALALVQRNYHEVAGHRDFGEGVTGLEETGQGKPGLKSAGLDLPGMALYLPAVLTLILGVSLQPSFSGAGLLILSAPLFWALYRAEVRLKRPLLDVVYLCGNRRFGLANLTSTLGYAAGFSTGFLVSLLLQGVMGLSASHAGYVVLVQPLIMTLASPLAGWLSDRFHPGRVSAAGLAVLGLAMFALSGLGPGVSLARTSELLAASGFGFALFVSPNIHAIMRSADASHMGMASGLLATMRGLGMCLSLSVTGIVLALFAGQPAVARIGADILPALRLCFVLSGLIGLAAAWVSWRGAGTVRHADR